MTLYVVLGVWVVCMALAWFVMFRALPIIIPNAHKMGLKKAIIAFLKGDSSPKDTLIERVKHLEKENKILLEVINRVGLTPEQKTWVEKYIQRKANTSIEVP